MREITICADPDVPADILDDISEGLRAAFDQPVRRGQVLFLEWPELDSIRQQYLADAVLSRMSEQHGLTLGIVLEDLYSPGLNFVFGLAKPALGRCVISLSRLASPDRGLFLRRARIEAVHEVGHLLHLPHCTSPACVMRFSNSLADTDQKEATPCPECKQRLRRVIA
jgi:archaemetzincin